MSRPWAWLGRRASVCSGARSRALGSSSSAGATHVLPRVQGPLGQLAPRARIAASSGLEHHGKKRGHCCSLTRVLKTSAGKEFLIALQLLWPWGIRRRDCCSNSTRRITATPMRPTLCSTDRSQPATCRPPFLLPAAAPCMLC